VPEHPIFAKLYDSLLAGSEKAGLAEMRGKLLAEARGRTIEIGAGSGLNLPHYTDAVTELILAEPDPHMAVRLRERLAEEPPAPERVEVIGAGAEELPYDDGSVDTIVSTLVLCTVPDGPASIAEARRVLRADGKLLFIEHVRSDSKAGAWWQDRVERPWGFFAGGCHPNRDTAEALAGAGFGLDRLDRDTFPAAGATPWMKPLIRGVARRP
jgi:ubiquinone/menaquinone biosynthesis C-methylase UbiE